MRETFSVWCIDSGVRNKTSCSDIILRNLQSAHKLDAGRERGILFNLKTVSFDSVDDYNPLI